MAGKPVNDYLIIALLSVGGALIVAMAVSVANWYLCTRYNMPKWYYTKVYIGIFLCLYVPNALFYWASTRGI